MVSPSDSRTQRTRDDPMEILVLGLCRTGTMSMKIALGQLGYGNVYHMSSIFDNESHARLWAEALEEKYDLLGTAGDSKQFTAGYWDKILVDYNAITDIPAVCFAKELIAAYPSAKIIITTRAKEGWHRSMIRTIHALHSSHFDRFMLHFANDHIKSASHLLDRIISHYFEGSIAMFGETVFETHNNMVEEVCLRNDRKFLKFKMGNGWEPLCNFLGKDVPDMPFPHVNDSDSFRAAFKLDFGRNILIISAIFGCMALLGIFGWGFLT